MTPEELAALHPRLFHLTTPGAWPTIAARGLLSTAALVALFELPTERRAALTGQRRPAEVPLRHPAHGLAVLNDNLPLSEAALAGCLDDGLTPADWLGMLNARVFFWADEAGLARLVGARMNRGRAREVLVFDTLPLARAHAERLELCPINSGATLRRPARRGLSTFTPLGAMSHAEWRRRRGMSAPDRILEVAVRDGVPDIARFLVERREVRGA
ncbi:MAG: hypothetical protein K2X74_12060 [Acetobacteraceae bacterium]|nr:hypothetical protein [Acetobacteraceae bacterium]